jgi:hypothetical protein
LPTPYQTLGKSLGRARETNRDNIPKEENMKYLIVVAHPDDEVLGAGASIYKWTRRGDIVDVCIMST